MYVVEIIFDINTLEMKRIHHESCKKELNEIEE